MPNHTVGTREEWLAARAELLEREKALTRENDEISKQRRELPWVLVDKEYSFETEDGTKTLAELFDGRSQLVIYHFMFGEAYTAGCPVCSSGADTYDGAVAHLNARDVTFLCVSRAPLDRLLEYRRRMGWSLPWVSQNGDFNADFGAAYTQEQLAPVLESGNLGPRSRDRGTLRHRPRRLHGRGAGAERLRPRRRRHLPDLLDHRSRP